MERTDSIVNERSSVAMALKINFQGIGYWITDERL